MSDNDIDSILRQVRSHNTQAASSQTAEIDHKQSKIESAHRKQAFKNLEEKLPALIFVSFWLIVFAVGLIYGTTIAYPLEVSIGSGVVVAIFSSVLIYRFRLRMRGYLAARARRKA